MLKRYFENYISVNLSDYSKIGIDFEITKFLLAVTVLLCISFYVLNWYRGYMSLAVKKIIRHGAFGEENAMTLEELGLSDSRSVKWALSRDTRLSKLIKRSGAVQYTYEEYMKLSRGKNKKLLDKPNLESDKFYIETSDRDSAKNISDNYSPSIIKTTVLCVLFLLIFVGLSLMIPGTLSYINSYLSK